MTKTRGMTSSSTARSVSRIHPTALEAAPPCAFHLPLPSSSALLCCCYADAFVKRTPLRPPSRVFDVYVTTSRQRLVLLKRAHKLLLEDRLPFIVLHALGAAIAVAVELALQLMGDLDAAYSTRARPPTAQQILTANEEAPTASGTEEGRPSPSSSLPSPPPPPPPPPSPPPSSP